ncbi:MAG: MFS transporter [Bacteroidota bacterium]|jgi:metabolite-proton symporter|nr:MFS transporter [Bacteroidota bacterium]
MDPIKRSQNSTGRVLIASLAGTTIEFFDFYIYATAAVLVFPKIFFPAANETTATLESLATFALAFFARPVGAALFGHFGDRIGRKATLVAALLTMGTSTIAIGLLPSYQSIGITAPLLLAFFRFGQGLGLGGEWGGAVLLATENAPPGKKAWYGMFPQLGAPLGFLLSTGIFLLLGNIMSDQQFLNYGWRIPFIASALLVWVGLYVRLKLIETPDFLKIIENNERVKLPIVDVFRKHTKALVLGTIASITVFLFFYLMTVFTLSWGTSVLKYPHSDFLTAQIISMLFFAIGILISAALADRHGRGNILIIATTGIFIFGLFFSHLFVASHWGIIVGFLTLGMFLMGLTYGPLGTALAEIFPVHVRYTGASLSFTLAGILGASLTPYLATRLANSYGIEYVGYYLSIAAVLSFIALIIARPSMKDNAVL